MSRSYNEMTEKKQLDITQSPLIPWNLVSSLSCRDHNDHWESDINSLMEMMFERHKLFDRVWANALGRLHIVKPARFPLSDYLGNLFELFHHVPLFVNAAEYESAGVEAQNRYVLRSLAAAMLSLIKMQIIEESKQHNRERKAYRDKVTTVLKEEPGTLNEKPPLILKLVGELLDQPKFKKPEMAGLALFYPRLIRYEVYQNLAQRGLELIWPSQCEEASKRIFEAHNKAKERWSRNRDYQSAVDKQNDFIERLEEQLHQNLNEIDKVEVQRILERRYALRERVRQQFKEEAADFALGGSVLPLSQKLLAWIFDPEGQTSSDTWGRYGNRFKNALLLKVSQVKESYHESVH